ncbi:hypothetical protein [Candidatus Laterigemmans baculatus]|uniref:hypothetical protein n=1 Tax=Candidatus Laterigemmans baculatus TaxID=2770505 RepID=UPI0013DCCBD7|nr:hypothetical protein [Candidatus Laterigemmans baculatus]
MHIDLRSFVAPLVEAITTSVQTFHPHKLTGPGDPGGAIHQIVLGYQFDQSAWVSLVFDMRQDADVVYDGEWQSYIEENVLECDVSEWMDAVTEIYDNGNAVAFTAIDGTSVSLGPFDDSPESDEQLSETLAAYFGSVVREAAIIAKNGGVFKPLPLASVCYLRVDEHQCQYAWPEYEDRGEATDDGRLIAE